MLKPIFAPKGDFFLEPIVIDVAAVAIRAELFGTWIGRYPLSVLFHIYRPDDLNALVDSDVLFSIGALIHIDVCAWEILKKPKGLSLDSHGRLKSLFSNFKHNLMVF